MSSYLLHDRTLKLYRGEEISSYPVQVKIIITFSPGDAFGFDDGKIRSTYKYKKDEKYRYEIDNREGLYLIINEFINLLHLKFQFNNLLLELEGNNLNIHTTFNSKDELLRFITSANQFLPALFSFRFQTYIWISDFRIVYEKGLYYFFVSQIRLPITATTEDVAIGHIKQSIQQWLLTQSGEERIIYSFYYYRQALRLSKLEPAAQTLLPEVILNLAKSLEMIFSDKRDRFRRLANEAGLDSDFVESKLIPILILRSKLGIAHVSTSPLTLAQKDNIYTFMVKAFNNVQYALNYISEKVKNNEYVLEPISTELDREEINIIESIQRYLELPDQHPL